MSHAAAALPERRCDDVTIRDGKERSDRTVPLPQRLLGAIREQIETGHQIRKADLTPGYSGPFYPELLEQKYRNASKELICGWFFPAARLTQIARKDEWRRYHLHAPRVHQAVKRAANEAGILKRVHRTRFVTASQAIGYCRTMTFTRSST